MDQLLEPRAESSRLRQQIAFIACSKSKKRIPDKARKFYQGSLFKKALCFCEARFDRIYILSAKYGLVGLDDVLSPYDLTLNRMTRPERLEWAEKVKRQIKEKGLIGSFWFFAGERYSEFFEGKKPLQGLSLGRQLRWFNERLRVKGFNV